MRTNDRGSGSRWFRVREISESVSPSCAACWRRPANKVGSVPPQPTIYPSYQYDKAGFVLFASFGSRSWQPYGNHAARFRDLYLPPFVGPRSVLALRRIAGIIWAAPSAFDVRIQLEAHHSVHALQSRAKTTSPREKSRQLARFRFPLRKFSEQDKLSGPSTRNRAARCGPRRDELLTSMARAWARPCLVMRPCLAVCRPGVRRARRVIYGCHRGTDVFRP